MLINHGVVLDTGQVDGDATGPAVAFQNAFGYTASKVLLTLDAVAATDGISGGVKVSPTGFIRCVNATSGLPAGAQWIGGFPISPTGQLCVNTGAVSSPSYVNGIAVDSNGAVYAGGLV